MRQSGSALCACSTDDDESCRFVKCFREVGGYLYTQTAARDVGDQRTRDASTHPIRIGEQILELEVVLDRSRRCEADNLPVNDSNMRERQQCGVPHQPFGMGGD